MNPDSGRIIDWPTSVAEMVQAKAEGFEELPPSLNRAARRAMAKGQPVNLAGRSKLAAWARERRALR